MEAFQANATIGPNGSLVLNDLPYASGQAVRVRIESIGVQKGEAPRVFALHLGAVSMSDDFDEPLPETFWVKNQPVDGSCLC